VAVVTGAGRGIGVTIAQRLAKHDLHVVILDVLDDAAAVADDIASAGASAEFVRCDLTDAARVTEVADQVARSGRPVRVVVNNAGWSVNEKFLVQHTSAWDRLISVNFTAVLNVCHAFLPHLEAGAAIVNVASDAARIGISGQAVYAGAKAGVIGFSKSLAAECGRTGVRVNVVSPGSTRTPLLDEVLGDEDRAKRARAIPLGRLGEPDNVADAVVFLATGATHVTGQVLSVNGGAARVG
jgi:2-hydroxycyclohexanecarboxyl-CoA dehydrogenase